MAGEDLLGQIMQAHIAKINEATAKVPAGGAVTHEQLNALRDEVKQLVVSMVSSLGSTMVSTISSTAAPMMAAAAKEASGQSMEAMCKEMDARTQSIVDEGVSRMQALTARVTDMIAEDRKEDRLERKALMTAIAALSKPRKRTGVVKLPSGEVQMTVTETVQ